MATIPFNKPASTPEELLAKLERQGLVVDPGDRTSALAYLRFVGGYRLKGYWHDLVDPSTKRFPAGYGFNALVRQYEFDRELRAVTLEYIERLEIAVRAAMANYLSLKHSPHWFLDEALFKEGDRRFNHRRLLTKIEEEVERARDKTFVSHYFARYSAPRIPPSWSISECVSFGLWSRTYKLLRDPNDRKAISKRFGIDQADVFESWLHTLTVLRNVAAHHGQLLRVKLRVAPRPYRRAEIEFADPKAFFATATIIAYLVKKTGLPNEWQSKLSDLFAKFPDVAPAQLGFPGDWRDRL